MTVDELRGETADAAARPRAHHRRSAPAGHGGFRAVWSNAFSLYSTTILTSALGFAFWWLAARLYEPSTVGLGAGLLSAMQTVAMLATFGVNTLLIAELGGSSTDDAPTLVRTATAAVAAIACLAGFGAALILHVVSDDYRAALGIAGITLFTVTVALTAVTIVLDDACIGVLRGQKQLVRNGVFAVTKLIALPLLAVVLSPSNALVFSLAWTVGLILSLGTFRFLFRSLSDATQALVSLRLVRELGGTALRYHWINFSLYAPRLLLPVIATPVIGAADAAALFTALLLINFALIVPSHFSTVLFALKPGDVASLGREVRYSLSICLVVGVVSAPFIWLLAPWGLRIFSPEYVDAATAMGILGLATVPWAVKSHFVAICRLQRHLSLAAWGSSAGAVLEIALLTAGGMAWGMVGVASGFVVALYIEAVAFAWPVFAPIRQSRALMAGHA